MPKRVCYDMPDDQPVPPAPGPLTRAGVQHRHRPRPCGSGKRHGIRIADTCFPNPEHLVKEENLPETEDVHVVLIDDPLVLIVPNCGKEKTTTCGPPLRRG